MHHKTQPTLESAVERQIVEEGEKWKAVWAKPKSKIREFL